MDEVTLELSDEETAFLAGIMSVQGAFTRTGGASNRIGWIISNKNAPETVSRVAELTGERLRMTKRGNVVVVAGKKLTELMEIVSEWLDPDRYNQYLEALQMAAALKAERRANHLAAVAERESRVREMRLMTRDRRRKLAELTYYNQDPAIQVVDDPTVAEAEVNRAILKRQLQRDQQKNKMRSSL